MKNEIKPDMAQEKARFFAQYWGQDVLFMREEHDLALWKVQLYTDDIVDWHLLLTPLSQITDEDAIEVGRLHGHQDDEDNGWSDEYLLGVGKRVCSHFPEFTTPVSVSDMIMIVDYLRSKGYALPFMGRSVEQMVELGWIKLKGDSNHG